MCNPPCVFALITDYLKSLKARNYSPRSLENYEFSLQRLVKFLSIERIQDVTIDHLDAYRLHLVESNLAPFTINRYLRTVRSFFNYLELTHAIFVNPATRLPIPRPPRLLKPVPSPKAVKTLLAQPDITTAVGIRDRTLLEVLYSCALRRREAMDLTIFDPDLQQGALRIKGKGDKERVTPLGKQAIFWLKKYLQSARPKLISDPDEQMLWISKLTGKTLRYDSIDRLFKRYSRKAGIENFSPHSIRRACATHMLQSGAHPIEIQLLVGHQTMAHLSSYLKVSIIDLKKMHKQSKPGK